MNKINLEGIKAIIFDLDGTIYYGNSIIDGAKEVIEYLRKKNIKIFFLTNNSTKSRKQIFEKLINMGIKCEIEDIFTSGYIAAEYSQRKGLKNIFIMGSENLKDEFENKGIKVIQDEDKAENLLIGYDTKFNYSKMTQALHVALKGNTIIACNKERHYPGEEAKRMPGCGAMVGAIEYCANRKVDFVVGKPNTLMLEILAEKYDLIKEQMLVIGDTYESDIKMAKEFGCKSILISNDKFIDTVTVDKLINILKIIK